MTDSPRGIRVCLAPADFTDYAGLLDVLHAAYAYMEWRIDPPSSLLRMDADQLRTKSANETLIVAFWGNTLVGCAFAGVRDHCVYVGKLAVAAAVRGRGVARRLIQEAESIARAHGRPCLELETRIELTENHATFRALGFRKIAETAHPGFTRPTSITMQRPVAL